MKISSEFAPGGSGQRECGLIGIRSRRGRALGAGLQVLAERTPVAALRGTLRQVSRNLSCPKVPPQSAEKDDMNCPNGTSPTASQLAAAQLRAQGAVGVVQTRAQGVEQPELGGGEFARIVAELLRQDREACSCAERPLACVWSSLDGCTCRASIPEDVVAAAWQRELDGRGEAEGRFFHFIWEGGVWAAYGLPNGDVRGVYCPSHNSQRAARTRAAICGPTGDCGAGAIVNELPLAA